MPKEKCESMASIDIWNIPNQGSGNQFGTFRTKDPAIKNYILQGNRNAVSLSLKVHFSMDARKENSADRWIENNEITSCREKVSVQCIRHSTTT